MNTVVAKLCVRIFSLLDNCHTILKKAIESEVSGANEDPMIIKNKTSKIKRNIHQLEATIPINYGVQDFQPQLPKANEK